MHSLSKKVWRCPWHFLAFGYGLGLSPIAPGTFGSLLGLLYFSFLSSLSWLSYGVIVAIISLFGIWLCGVVSRDLGVHDHSGIVWDEVAGILITFWGAPFRLDSLIIGFLLFRLFDIWKPWPIKVIDAQVKGGLGIMLDDIFAAIPAWFCLAAYIAIIG